MTLCGASSKGSSLLNAHSGLSAPLSQTTRAPWNEAQNCLNNTGLSPELCVLAIQALSTEPF